VCETVSESTSDFIKKALFETVDSDEGTGKAGRVAGYKVGGKTGTAQKLPRSANNYLLSFAGFVPADDPQVLVYVIVDTPNLEGKEQAHSTFATGIFQQIMADILPYMNVFPDTDVVTEENESLSTLEEGITNNNENGMEPEETTDNIEETETGEGGEEPSSERPEEPDEEVIPYDDGLGLPDNLPQTVAAETLAGAP
jgi:stage V sporulation protein D (sporulation-specific penicillin-binding protein)